MDCNEFINISDQIIISISDQIKSNKIQPCTMQKTLNKAMDSFFNPKPIFIDSTNEIIT